MTCSLLSDLFFELLNHVPSSEPVFVTFCTTVASATTSQGMCFDCRFGTTAGAYLERMEWVFGWRIFHRWLHCHYRQWRGIHHLRNTAVAVSARRRSKSLEWIHRAPDFCTAESGKNFNSKKCCICMCLHKISFIFDTCSRCVYKYFSGPNGRTGWANLDPILGGIRPVIWAHADNVQFPNTVAALQLPWQAEASQAIWSFLSSKRRWTPYWSILMACWF